MEAKILSQHHQISRQVEAIKSKKQVEILLTFLPEEIVATISSTQDPVSSFDGVVLFIDISCINGITSIDRRLAQEGIFTANATINGYLSAIIEIVNYYDGDIQKLIPSNIIAVWKSKPELYLYKIIDKVILCAENIQKIVGHFNGEMDIDFNIKQIISCGNITLGIIGNDVSKSWVLLGDIIEECLLAKTICHSSDILITLKAWGHLHEERYSSKYTLKGFVQILSRVFQQTESQDEKKHEADKIKIMSLCSEHLKLRNALCAELKAETPKNELSKQNLIKIITPRKMMLNMANRVPVKEIESFVIKPVKEKIKNHQPLEYLTEICEAVIQTIYLTSTHCDDQSWYNFINTAYCTIHKIVSKNFGSIINTATEWKKTTIFLVAFGIQTNHSGNDCKIALITAQDIIQELELIEILEVVNIKVTSQLVHCSVLGHPHRQDYFVLGSKIEKGPLSKESKIFCDDKVCENSKLPSHCFLLQDTNTWNADFDSEIFYEYNGSSSELQTTMNKQSESVSIIGRNDELQFIRNVIFNTKSDNNFQAVVIKGQSKSGKSIILRKIVSEYENSNYPLAFVNLCGGKSKPYFCVSAIYSQLVDLHAAKSAEVLPRRKLWEFEDTLQLKNSSFAEDIKQSMKIFENFLKICKTNTLFSIIVIDNIQFIDMKSLQLIEDMIKLDAIRVISAGLFEEDKLHILWKFSLSNHFKIIDLEPLGQEYIPELICHFLDVQGVMRKITDLVKKVCDGRPGWIETCLLELLNKKDLQIKCIHYSDNLKEKFIFPNLEKRYKRYTVMYVRIATIGSFGENNLRLMTPDALTMNFFESFPSYQQIIIKTAAVIGDMFTRSSLIVILELPNNNFFTYAIKCLFDEEIFECGSKYFLNNAKVLTNELSCVCHMKNEEKLLYRNFPKYAFCKILHFRNRILRKIAYQLLSANQRKDLHLKVTELLEYENTLCPQCSQHRASAIIKIKKYKDMIVLVEPTKEKHKSQVDIKVIKNVMRQEISNAKTQETSNEIATYTPNKIAIQKTWKPTKCFCLEILTRIYSDLVYHSQRADHLAKQIFFMYQYGSILILIGELEDAIILLKEASQLCFVGDPDKTYIPAEYSKFIFSRIVTAIAEAYYHLDNLKAAKNYILLCFREQDIPIIPLEYNFCFKVLKRNGKPLLDSITSESIGSEEYVGQSLAILMRILAAENQWNLALSVAESSMVLLKRENMSVTVLCDVCSRALDICSLQGDSHTCEQLEKCVYSILLQLYSTNGTIEFFAIAKLMNTLFVKKAKSDIISNAIKIGYKLYHINYALHAEIFQMETVPILSELLLSSKRIEEAVYIVTVTRKMTKDTFCDEDLFYFTFCIDMMLDCSFYKENIDTIESFVDNMGCTKINKTGKTIAHNYLIICLVLHFQRTCNWIKVDKWKDCYTQPSTDKNDHMHIKFKLRNLELQLLKLAKNLNLKKIPLEAEFQGSKLLITECEEYSKNWKFYMPKFQVYFGYFNKLKRKVKYKMFLKLGLQEASLNGNLQIHCWINMNSTHWNTAHDKFLINDFSFIHWKKSRDLNLLDWAQIMYPLPVP